MLKTPVLLLVFNRPEKTQRVFEKIRSIGPKILFVAGDGPRADVTSDVEKCQQTRELVVGGIDWDCELHTLFREENLGCGLAVSSSISWFFKHVEEGIILEDDIVPNRSFFYYCSELLDYYRDDMEIAMIGGYKAVGENQGFSSGQSYCFSNYNAIWGWATWRRTWQYYNFDLSLSDLKLLRKRLKETYRFPFYKRVYWEDVFRKMLVHSIDTWDYQLTFSIWLNNMLCIIPDKNLIQNIGFDEEATHTTQIDDRLCQKAFQIELPLIHALNKEANHSYDSQLDRIVYYINPNKKRAILKMIIKFYVKPILRVILLYDHWPKRRKK